MKYIAGAVILLLLVIPMTVYSQVDGKLYRTDAAYLQGVKVTADGKEKTLAWAGGLNNPQFGVVDLNHDGIKDIVVYEQAGDASGIKTFLNYGAPGNPDYRYAPGYEFRFPYPYKYMKLLDYNCDNIPDYIYGTFVQYVCDGYYDSGDMWNCKNCREIRYPVGTATSNIPVLSDDIPGVADIDGDHDLDLVCFTQVGYMELYKSMRVEESKPCDSLQIRFKDRCWGKVKQDAPRQHILGLSCDNSGLKTTKTTDYPNGVCLFDSDGDGDMDVLVGNQQYSDIQYLKNGKVEYNYPVDTMIAQDTTWQSGGKKLYMPTYPTAYWVDMDNDNNNDIVISPQVSGENYHCVAYYRNTGTQQSPSYVYQSDSFMVDKMIDLGSNSYPVFYDYDKDGKKDLFVGARGFYQFGTTYKTALYYFKNTTTGNNISFELASRNFLSIDTIAAQGAALSIGDIDNDGLDDLVAGRLDGTIVCYKNHATGSSVQPVWQLYQHRLTDSAGQVIDVGNYAAPCIYDIDKDGKNDLVIGNQTGYLSYYKNIGTGSQPKFAYRTNKLGGVKAEPTFGYSAPFFGPVDNLEKEYLMVGSEAGVIYRYTGFQNGNVTSPYTMVDSVYSELHIPGMYIAPAFADLDGDKKYEAYIGNEKGGLFLYRQLWNVGVSEVPEAGRLKVYPNPALNTVNITTPFEAGTGFELRLYDNLGRLVKHMAQSAGGNNVNIDISDLHSGIYLCVLRSKGISYSAAFIKQ